MTERRKKSALTFFLLIPEKLECNVEVDWSEVDRAITQRNDVLETCCCFFA